jgi:hypothetical protein
MNWWRRQGKLEILSDKGLGSLLAKKFHFSRQLQVHRWGTGPHCRRRRRNSWNVSMDHMKKVARILVRLSTRLGARANYSNTSRTEYLELRGIRSRCHWFVVRVQNCYLNLQQTIRRKKEKTIITSMNRLFTNNWWTGHMLRFLQWIRTETILCSYRVQL